MNHWQLPREFSSLNAHKIHGPKGVGALYIRRGVSIAPLIHGGEQEFMKRAGTENMPGIVGFAEAARLAFEQQDAFDRMSVLRDKIIDTILKIDGVQLNGPREKRLCNNVNVSFKGIEGEAIVGSLSDELICLSTGSACSEALLEPSHVLRAIGLNDEEANGSLRITLSRFTTEADVDKFLALLPGVVTRLREISPFWKEEEQYVLGKNTTTV